MDKTQAKEKSKEPLDLLRLIKLLAPRLIYTLGGFLCGIAVLPFSAIPFGIALLSAADSRAIFVYPGLAIACLFSLEGASGAIFLGVYTAIVLLRALVRLTLDYPPLPKEESKPRPKELLGILFEERVGYRIICATLSSLALGVCLVVGGGF